MHPPALPAAAVGSVVAEVNVQVLVATADAGAVPWRRAVAAKATPDELLLLLLLRLLLSILVSCKLLLESRGLLQGASLRLPGFRDLLQPLCSCPCACATDSLGVSAAHVRRLLAFPCTCHVQAGRAL